MISWCQRSPLVPASPDLGWWNDPKPLFPHLEKFAGRLEEEDEEEEVARPAPLCRLRTE